MLIGLALSAALAQDSQSLDAHGFALAPSDGDVLDYLATWRTERQTPGSFGVNGLFEYAESPLVLVRRNSAGVETREVLVDNLVGLNLGASYAPTTRLAVAVAAPVYFTSAYTDEQGQLTVNGPTLGDLRLAVPVGILLPDEKEGGPTLSVVPFADLPTGNNARNLGNAGLGGGAFVAAGMVNEALSLDANLGANFTPAIDFENLRGGTKLIANLGLGYSLTRYLGFRGEVNYRPSVSSNEVPGTESPGEFLFSARGRQESGFSWTGGLALPFTRGASAALFRVFGGAGFTWGKPIDPDTDGDGLRDSTDPCPAQAETVNGWKDADGCPDRLAKFTVTVKDEDGNTMPGSTVFLNGKEYHADAKGRVVLTEVMPGSTITGYATHPWYYDANLRDVTLREGEQEASLTLDYRESKVRVLTHSADGTAINAMVTFQGPFNMPPSFVGTDGEEVFDVRPGDWRVLVSADSFATERREIHLDPGETSTIVIEVPMKPAKTKMVAKEIQILEQVFFDFDKDTIQEQSFPLLTEVANILLQHKEITLVEIQGHTDDKGDDGYNLLLSQRRTDAVRGFLNTQGVEAERLQARGYGETMPIADNKKAAGRALNRRVQFVILQQQAVEVPDESPESPTDGTGGAVPTETPAPP